MTIQLVTPDIRPRLTPAMLGVGPSAGIALPGISSQLAVPDVLGMTESDAQELLQGFGLVPSVVRVPGPGTDGQVYGQQPRPDDIVGRGSGVRVFVISSPGGEDESQRFDAIDARLAELMKQVAAIATAVSGPLETESSAKQRYESVSRELNMIISARDGGATGE